MSAPLFTIITPILNRVRELEATLASVLSQQTDLFEYLIIDGGSTDGTLEILRAMGKNVRWISEPDSGVYDAMNKGLKVASGEFIYFLGAGDALRPGILEKVSKGIPRDQMTYFYGNVYSEAHHRVYNGRYSNWKLSRINICHQAVFCHRHLFEVIGPFDTRYKIVADHVSNMKVFGTPGLRKVYCNLVIADFAAGGLSHSQTDPQLVADRLELVRQHLGPFAYALNKSVALLPAGLKEARYQVYQRLRARLRGK